MVCSSVGGGRPLEKIEHIAGSFPLPIVPPQGLVPVYQTLRDGEPLTVVVLLVHVLLLKHIERTPIDRFGYYHDFFVYFSNLYKHFFG